MEKTKRKFPVLAVIAVILAVLAAGVLFLVLAPGPRMHWALTMGEKYLTQGNYEQAVTMFTRAIQVDDRAEAAYLGRAEAYTQLGENEAAEADLTFVIDELGTEDAEVYLTRAAVYDALQQPEKAQADRDTAQEMGADIPESDTTDTPAAAEPTPEPTATPKPTKTVSLPVTVTDYNDDGSQGYQETFRYSAEGIMLEYDYGFKNLYHELYQYDNDGHLVGVTYEDSGGVSTYTYDDHGNMIYFNTTEDGDYGDVYYSYEYDEQGRILHATGGLEPNGTDYEFMYTYSDDGSYTLDEYIRVLEYYHRVTTFAANGLAQESHTYGYNESFATEDVTYDAFGNMLIHYTRNEDGSPALSYVYTYDDRGRILSETSTQLNQDALLPGMSATETTTYTYTYDSNGNVIGREEYRKGVLMQSISYQVFEVSPEYVTTVLNTAYVPTFLVYEPTCSSYSFNRYAVLN